MGYVVLVLIIARLLWKNYQQDKTTGKLLHLLDVQSEVSLELATTDQLISELLGRPNARCVLLASQERQPNQFNIFISQQVHPHEVTSILLHGSEKYAEFFPKEY